MSRPPYVQLPDWFGENRMSDLAIAAYCGDEDGVTDALRRNCLVDGTDAQGHTALYWACFKSGCHDGYLEVVRRLLVAGADSSIGSTDYDSPLNAACRAGSPEVVEELLKAGADPNDSVRNWTPLIAAIQDGCEECIKLLIQYGADVRQTDRQGHSPRHWANKYRRADILLLLPTM